MLESQRGHIWGVFHFLFRFITFGGHSAHLAYLVHKSGRKTSIIISGFCQISSFSSAEINIYRIEKWVKTDSFKKISLVEDMFYPHSSNLRLS